MLQLRFGELREELAAVGVEAKEMFNRDEMESILIDNLLSDRTLEALGKPARPPLDTKAAAAKPLSIRETPCSFTPLIPFAN